MIRGRSLLCLIALMTACGPEPESTLEVPEPDMTDMEPQVAERLREVRATVLANPDSAEAWGRFGMVAHAHELWDEAQTAYRQAEKLDPSDKRWPYFLGDVLSVVGTDLEAAERALRRAMELYPDYGPAHMRLGKVLLASDQVEAATAELERALELNPDLQPARVALAQARLFQGRLEDSEKLLSEVLTAAPRHAQALSTLGQVFMRQGRRQEAREIAGRARTAAKYNLFSDPLMAEVDAQARSAVVLWERAKAFFDNGNFEQAARGLRLVVELKPSNPAAHLQLAVAYGNLGDLRLARRHLERAVSLDPELLEPRIRLASVCLEQQDYPAAIEHLRVAVAMAPDDPDAGWLLGRALLLAGDYPGALTAFERTEATGVEVPGWAHNEWGRALAQTGQSEAALDHFAAALAEDSEDAQALFYTGLILEGSGRIEEALESYCRSMRAEPNPPAAARLQQLDGECG